MDLMRGEFSSRGPERGERGVDWIILVVHHDDECFYRSQPRDWDGFFPSHFLTLSLHCPA